MGGIGKALVRLRKEAGLKQTELAAAAGVTQPDISYWERGEREPTLSEIHALEVALGLERRGALLLAAGLVEPLSPLEEAIEADPRLNAQGRRMLRSVYESAVAT